MALLKRLAAFATVGLVAFTLVGCGNSVKKDVGEADDAVGIYPREIEKLMNREYKQAIKDVGMATHPDKIAALKKARMDADTKIARQFEQEVASLRKSYVEYVNDKSLDHQSEVNETFTLIKLRGSEVAKEMLTEGKDGYTAYVLKVVSAEKLKQLADQQADALTEFKATQAYKDLESRVAAEKEARAASGM
jgi:hypothetical protein